MAEAPGGDEASNPFDAPTSDRNPFPPFEAALADDQPEATAAAGEEAKEENGLQGAGTALDWSIDTLAELKPAIFSPLPQQKKEANVSGTSHGASGFFEDEEQYEVLRTPLPAVRPSTTAAAVNRSRAMTTPSPPLELHRRCRETIARCEARLWERQRKMDKLQSVLPPPTPKHPRATPPSRSTPPRPAKRNRLSGFATPGSDWKLQSPSTRPPKWSASPIAIVSTRQPLCATPATLHFDALTPSPLAKTPRDSTTRSSKLRLSFGLSPIAFPSPKQMQMQAEKTEEEGEDEEEEKVASNDDTLPLSSTEESAASVSPESEKENAEQQAQREAGRQQQSSSSHAPPPMPAAKKSVAPARRQQAFMEAMEAEARSNDSRKTPPPLTAAAAPSSILSLYQEARRLGMTDPQAQWQYVQTLRQSDQKNPKG